MPEVLIKDISDPEEVKKVNDVERAAWGTEQVVPPHIYIAGHYVGGILKGAYVNGRLVGFVFGIPGIYKGRLCHYSHQLAVIPEYRNLGIGRMLKLAQREECLRRGLDLVIWTFDPLQSLNAHFNLRKLSVIVRTYLVNHYGEMRDQLNRGLPSDRFLAEWWIRSGWVRERLERKNPEKFVDRPENIAIEVGWSGANPEPGRISITGEETISIPIPGDINRIKREDISLAMRWRMATREAFTKAFSMGYVAIDFIYDKNSGLGYYILRRGFEIE